MIALGDNIRTIDPIGSALGRRGERTIRTLIFNTLVKKDEKFDYAGELASDIKRSDDGLTYTFTLRDGVKFHDGKVLTSADVKYTLDLVFSSNFAKSASFYEGTGADKRSYIKSVEAPDARTVVVTLIEAVGRVALEPRSDRQSFRKTVTSHKKLIHSVPVHSSLFVTTTRSRFVTLKHFRSTGKALRKYKPVRVRVISDMNALQAELQSGRVDIAPMPTSLSPDAVKRLEQDPNLQVKAFPGFKRGPVDVQYVVAASSTT